jgi:DnaJ homolog subfamily A member 2
VLTDPEKKKIYDQYGEEGLEGNGPNGPGGDGGFDVFQQFFNQGDRKPGGGERKRKAKSVLHLLDLSLTDVYSGTKKKMKITRDRICKDCNGKGGKEDSIMECVRCHGAGRVIQTISRGFMMTQSISACDQCHGRGKVIKDKCKKCNRACVVSDVKEQKIDVEKGTPDGHRYVFKGEADEYVRLIKTK